VGWPLRGVAYAQTKSNIHDELIGKLRHAVPLKMEAMMIAFEAPLAGETPQNARVQSLNRRMMIAVMALLIAIGAVALVSTNDQIAAPANRPVLACGSTPGFCPNPPKSSSANHTTAPRLTSTAETSP
jgi:hypothetical protein